MAHLKKYRIVRGDACVEFPKYLGEHPETIVALAYFDFDLYEPTRVCLEHLRDHLVKGSVVAFDELHLREFPGETLAVREVLGLRNCRLVRSALAGSYQAYMVVE